MDWQVESKYRIDWLSYTVKPVSFEMDFTADNASDFMLLVLPEFILNNISFDDCVITSGMHGYKYKYTHVPSGLFIMFGYNEDSKSISLGINVTLSGSVIRYFCPDPAYDKGLGRFVLQFPTNNPGYVSNVCRVDICLDVDYPFQKFFDLVEAKLYKTPVFQGKRKDGKPGDPITRFVNDEHEGTLYIGKKISYKFLRIYDKLHERRCKLSGQDLRHFNDLCVETGVNHCTRLELSCRNGGKAHQWATIALQMFLDNDSASVFYHHIKFGEIDGYDHNGHPRFVCYDWWSDLLYKGLILFNDGTFKPNDIVVPEVSSSAFNLAWFVRTMECMKSVFEVQPELYSIVWDTVNCSQRTLEKLYNTPKEKFELCLKFLKVDYLRTYTDKVANSFFEPSVDTVEVPDNPIDYVDISLFDSV